MVMKCRTLKQAMRNTYKSLFKERKRTRILARPGLVGGNNIRIDLKWCKVVEWI
jgi:hypothetical protein